jgi:histone H3/H4
VETKMVELLVQSKVRKYIKGKGLNTGGETLEALDKRLGSLIDDAAARAKANDRKTLMAKDV